METKEALERQCKTDKIKKGSCFLNCLKSSGTPVDYNSFLSDRTLSRDREIFLKDFKIC